MFNAPYEFYNIGRETLYGPVSRVRIIYKFKARHRTYLVMLEICAINVVAVKYCDRRDLGSKNAFTKIFPQQDNDAIKVLSTCLHIMLAYWSKNPTVNFTFLATLRSIPPEVIARRKFKDNPELSKRYQKIRFTLYKYAMYNLFSPEDFEHSYDSINCVYLLINKKEQNAELIIRSMTSILSYHCELLFDNV